MKAQHKIWCDKDEHQLYEYYTDFNEWLESEDGQLLREEYGIDSLSKPSKDFMPEIRRLMIRRFVNIVKIAATRH